MDFNIKMVSQYLTSIVKNIVYLSSIITTVLLAIEQLNKRPKLKVSEVESSYWTAFDYFDKLDGTHFRCCVFFPYVRISNVGLRPTEILDPVLIINDSFGQQKLSRTSLHSFYLPLAGGGAIRLPILSDAKSAIESGCSQSGISAFAITYKVTNGIVLYPQEGNVDKLQTPFTSVTEAKFECKSIFNKKCRTNVTMNYMKFDDVNKASPDFFKYVFTEAFDERFEVFLPKN